MRPPKLIRARAIVSALLVTTSCIAGAQVSNASTAATGLSGAFTARATGYNAVAWNPANLAMPGNPSFSFTLLAIDGAASLKPIDLARIQPYSGKLVPASERELWMLDVTADSGQKGAIGGGVTLFGLSIGRLAFTANTKFAADMNLAPDAVEAVLFGNAGRTGTVKNLSLAGSGFQSAFYSTGAVSFGQSLSSLVPLTNFAVGATVKYTVGHVLLLGLDDGSALNTNSIKLAFPYVVTDTASARTGSSGGGVGLDVGAAWTIPRFRFGVTAQNVFNSFKWDTTKLVTRSATGTFDSQVNSFTADTVDKPYGTAPASIRSKVAGLKFKPVLAAGVAFDPIPKLTLSADIRLQAGGGIEVGPASLVGLGAEIKIIPFIPLRAGVSAMSDGFGASGGVGIHLLGFEVGVAGFLRKRNGGTESGGTINLFSIRP